MLIWFALLMLAVWLAMLTRKVWTYRCALIQLQQDVWEQFLDVVTTPAASPPSATHAYQWGDGARYPVSSTPLGWAKTVPEDDVDA